MITDIFNHVIFNGKDLLDFGIKVSGGGTFKSPSWDYEVVAVYGRDGDLLLPKSRVNALAVTYEASIAGKNLEENLIYLYDFLLQDGTYHKLEDTYHQDTFLMARYTGDSNPDFVTKGIYGATFNLEFSAIPRRYLKSGDKFQPIDVGQSVVLMNPTNSKANPLIIATGNGTITINGVPVTISNNEGKMAIDFDTQNAYDYDYPQLSMNKNISLVNDTYPLLEKGKNTISLSDEISIQIKPRWYRR